MVRVTHFLFLLLILTVGGCDTKNEFEETFKDYFIKYYGEDGKQQAVDAIVNSDGTMLLLGNTTSADGVRQIILVKVDADGNVIWQKRYGVKDEYTKDIEPTLDGNFVILSNIFLRKNIATGADEHDMHIIKVSPDGDVLSDSKFHFFGSQFGNTITPISDKYIPNGGYIVAGYTTEIKDDIESPDVRSTDLISFLFKPTLDDTVWTSRVFNQLDGEAIKVIESVTYDPAKINNTNYKDRPFYVFGFSDLLAVGDVDYENNFWCASLNENGISSFDDYKGDPVLPEKMAQTIDDHGSGFMSVGTQTNGSSSKMVMATSQVDGNGLKFGSRLITVNESKNLEAISIAISEAGGHYLILSNETNASGNTNIWLSKVDVTGEVIWSASFGSIIKNDFAASVQELTDGKIIVYGTIELESQNSKLALIKLNANGEFLN